MKLPGFILAPAGLLSIVVCAVLFMAFRSEVLLIGVTLGVVLLLIGLKKMRFTLKDPKLIRQERLLKNRRIRTKNVNIDIDDFKKDKHLKKEVQKGHVPDTTIYCPNCKNAIKSHQNFCKHCGTRL